MLVIEKATVNDVAEISQLVNRAYRGPDSRKGWTTEEDLIDGYVRITDASLEEMMQNENAVVLKVSDNNRTCGSVYLERQGDQLYLGMLAVDPFLQNKGTGKRILAAAEKHAIEKGCSSIIMRVITAREELIKWYERHGYHRTGVIEPFPPDNRFGTPKQPLDFTVLKKDLTT